MARPLHAAEIYIDRIGQVQINFSNLSDASSSNSGDANIADFNHYIGRNDAINPIEWAHTFDLTQPSDGTIGIDGDEVFTNLLAAEMFVVIWDVDYPSSNEHDILYWDTNPYAGGGGAAFSNAGNPGVVELGKLEGNNNKWGAKRVSVDTLNLGPGQTEYFWLRVAAPTGGSSWMSSIDYSDLAYIFNEGKLSISKSLSLDSGYDPPRVGHTTYYKVRIDISNPTLTSSGGPVYDVEVTDKFPAGSTILTNPGLGSASIDAAGNLDWDVGILQDGALNTPPAADSTDFLVVRVPITPALADVGVPITVNTGATISGGQVPIDPGDGTGTLYPFNYYSSLSSQTTSSSVLLVTPVDVVNANTGSITSTAVIRPEETLTVTVTDADLNMNTAAADTVTVTMTNVTTGETESLTLTETGVNTGIFEANLPNAGGDGGPSGNTVMWVKQGDLVRATYNDVANAAGNPATLTSDTNVIDDTNFVTITSPTGSFTTNTHDVYGDTEANCTVTMIHPITGVLLTTTSDAAGNYQFDDVNFPMGTTTFTVTSTDVSGNVANAASSITVDTSNFITITSPAPTSVINTPITDIVGLTDPGATVTMTDPVTGAVLTATADAAGNFTFHDVNLNTGSNTVNITSTDAAGNTDTDSISYVVDPDIALNITSIANGSTFTTQPHLFAGTTDPGATVTTTHPVTGATLTTTADAAGKYSFGIINFPEGTQTRTVNAEDEAGNTATSSVTFTIDLTNTNTITTSGTFTTSYIDINGTTDPLSTVTFQHPVTSKTYTVTADAAGNYVFEDVYFPNNSYPITTTSTDPTGHIAVDTSNITINTVSAFVPVLPPPAAEDAVIEASELVVMGSVIFLEVRDPETYRDPDAIDTLQVTVTNDMTGDTLTRTLVETGLDTGVFTGQLDTVDRTAAVTTASALAVLVNDTVTSEYTDPYTAAGLLNQKITDQTLITFDGLLVNVKMFSFTNGVQDQMPLSNAEIAMLEFDADGNVTDRVVNYETDNSGYIPDEFIGRMRRGYEYRIIINDSVNGFPYSQSQKFTLQNLEDAPVDVRGVRTYTLDLDPAGFVYDALTGARVNGTDVILYHQNGTQVVGPLTFYTQNPAVRQTNPQLSGDSTEPGGFEFIGTGPTTDLTAGYYYIEVTFGTNTALANTYLPVLLDPTGSWAGIQEAYAGQLFRVDLQNQPIGMRIPLSRFGTGNSLQIEKTANKDSAAVGDIVTFTVTVNNLSTSQTDPNNPVIIRDDLPVGYKYIDGSATNSSGSTVSTTKEAGGIVKFTCGVLAALSTTSNADSCTIYYQAAVDTSARPGTFLLNSAVATISDVVLSNEAQVLVRVVDDPLFDRATLIGRVYVDYNMNTRYDKDEPGIGNVGLLLDDGTYVRTDETGRYSVPGARVGLETSGFRVIKIDKNSLPENAVLNTPESRFVVLLPGGIDKANFGLVPNIEIQRYLETGQKNTASNGPDSSDKIQELFVAMFDIGLGEIRSGANTDPRPDANLIPEGGFRRARTALFYEIKNQDNFFLRTAYDSEKRDSFEIHREMDPELFYPTYGDSSTIDYLTETQNKFFLDANTLSARLMIGNYTVKFENTELVGINRFLSGLLYEYNKSKGQDNTSETSFTFFATKHKQLHARTELRATGGTHYYLAHSRIVSGSEKITIEIHDRLAPERVLSSRVLSAAVDYDVDYNVGQLRLTTPVAAYTYGDFLTENGINSGDPVWIVVEYGYMPEREEYGTHGARLLHWTHYSFGFGGSYLRENVEGMDHRVNAFDLHYRNKDQEVFKVEWAESEAGGVPWLASRDGGRSFELLGNSGASSGNAFKLDWKITAIPNISWENYYYKVDPDFTGQTYGERGIRRAGTSLAYEKGNRNLSVDYTRASTLLGSTGYAAYNSGGGRSRAYRVLFKEERNQGSYSLEYVRNYNNANADTAGTGLRNRATDTMAARYERKVTERITVTLSQQFTVSTYHNHQTRLGVKYKMNEKLTFIAEGVGGPRGSGGRLGFERKTGEGAAYMNFTSGYSAETGYRTVSTTAGVSRPLGQGTKAYMEYEGRSAADDAVARRTLGLNHDFEAGRDFNMSLSVERSEERSSTQGGYVTNTAYWSGAYRGGKTEMGAGAEYRRHTGSIQKEIFGWNFHVRGRPMRDVHMFAEYDYNVSDDLVLRHAESKYTKALVGFALRPSRTDRVNILTKAARVRELRTLAANDTLNPDSVSTILSIEGMYEVSHELTWREKVAAKHIRETVAPLPAARSKTLLWISGLTWKPTPEFDFSTEFRTRRQPALLNHRNGIAVEAGYTFKEKVRLGVGYNFSAYSDDEFARDDFSHKGVIFRITGKF